MRLLSLPLELSMLLAIAIASAIAQRDPSTRGRRTLVMLCLCVLIVAFGEWLIVRGFASERIGDRIKYIGSLALAPLWLGFCAQVAGLEIARRVPWFPVLLLAPALCVYPLLWSTGYGSLFLVTVEGADNVHGPLWFIVTTYHQALCALGCAILAVTAVHRRDARRTMRSLIVALVPMAAMIGGTLYRGGWLQWPYDAHPVLLGAALLVMREAFLGGSLLDLLPFPQRELLRQLPLGLVLTDRAGAVALINGAAERALGMEPGEAIGRDVQELLSRARRVTVDDQVLARGGRLLVLG
ncbi:MAG TPA: histidine kinase N-terminal 7TM domain-containing protein [Myxococcota bacterium]|nr:histidine kinase N-terminal 7TM domain-containing protein [Myxococcota bacterium]